VPIFRAFALEDGTVLPLGTLDVPKIGAKFRRPAMT